MKKLWLISAFLLALVVETAVSVPRRCGRYGCYSSIAFGIPLDKVEPVLEGRLIDDLAEFPTPRPALENPSVEEFPSDFWERLQRIKIDGAATEDGEDAI